MNDDSHQTNQASKEQPALRGRYRRLRVWPAVLLVVAMVVLRLLPGMIEDGPAELWMSAAFGPALCGILILLWWLIASRATWQERAFGLIGIAVGLVVSQMLVDPTMIGPATTVLTIPMGMAAFGIGAAILGRVLSFNRTVMALLLAFCGFGFSTTLRNDGMWGDFTPGFHWRWLASPEEQMLANNSNRPKANVDLLGPEIERAIINPEWPAFRGADRSGRQQGVKFSADWDSQPPKQMWKVAVGPGWSSFAIAGSLLFTQEQRGTQETVVCYEAETGNEVWARHIESRFDDPLGGPGPRATPTLADGQLFAMGAEGILMRLDPRSGEIAWQKDLRKIANRKPPMWGFCSSPLVVDDAVIVHAGGSGDKGTLAFDFETGDLKWSAKAGSHSYSSPQLSSLLGEDLILMLTDAGFNLLDPQNGTQVLDYQWPHNGYRVLQPQVVGADSVLLPTGMGAGTRRIQLAKESGQPVATELWTSRQMKPDFNDLVVYQSHAYGFDSNFFTCIDLENGERKWKGGRYGKGQVLLLEDSGLLLIASEYGDIVLLKADPFGHAELAKFKALEGKTWNHPVVVGDRLYLRNSQEAACFRLPLAEGQAETSPTAPSEVSTQ